MRSGSEQPVVDDALSRRSFACSPAAVVAFIVDERERLLPLSSPDKREAPGDDMAGCEARWLSLDEF